jgi:hypothetical protein
MVSYAFPSGLSGMYKALGVPFLYYMPYWCMGTQTNDPKWKFLTVEDCGWGCGYMTPPLFVAFELTWM